MAHLHEHQHCCSRSEECGVRSENAHEHDHHHDHEHQHEHHHDHEGHEHHHHEHSLKKQLWLILATIVLLILAVLIEKFQFSIFNFQLTTWQLLLVYFVPYLLIGHETLHEAWEGITHGL